MKKYEKIIYNDIKERVKKGQLNGTLMYRTVTKYSNGRYTRYSTDKATNYTNACDTLNLTYTFGNDAPRGGKLGDYIAIEYDKTSKIVFRIMQEIQEENQRKLEQARKKAEALENANFSNEEIENFILNYKESENMFLYRKENGISFRELRKALKGNK